MPRTRSSNPRLFTRVTNLVKKKPRLYLPPAGYKEIWEKINKTLENVIRVPLRRIIQHSVSHLNNLLYDFFSMYFSTSRFRKTKKATNCSRRDPKAPRQKLKELRKKWRRRKNKSAEHTSTLRKEYHQTRKLLTSSE